MLGFGCIDGCRWVRWVDGSMVGAGGCVCVSAAAVCPFFQYVCPLSESESVILSMMGS
jgi:hypothetical protein